MSSMDIYAKPGAKVRFTNAGGYDCEREHAATVLSVGSVYTVKRTTVHGWRTDVTLDEHPDETFNSVQFENVEG